MRQIVRTSKPAPASLMDPGRAGPAERIRARAYFTATRPPKKKFTFAAYKGDDVRHTLEALFHGKCAYCESRYDITGPVDIEHYRPKGKGEGTLTAYWWLAANWSNLLPSCLDCNRRRAQPTPQRLASLSALQDDFRRNEARFLIQTGKGSCFPIAGLPVSQEPPTSQEEAMLAAERPLLLDPCRDNPRDHIVFHIDRADPVGIVYPKGDGAPQVPLASDNIQAIEAAAVAANVSVRGAVSIQVYGLNRLLLIQERTRVLRKLEFLAHTMLDLAEIRDRLSEMKVRGNNAKLRDAALTRLRATIHRTLAEINAMAAPEAPFSELANAWIDNFKSST